MNWIKLAIYIVAVVGSWTFLVALTCRICGMNSRTNVSQHERDEAAQ